MHISKFDGLNNQQSQIGKLHAFGGRSISIWNDVTFQRVYDSGDDMERESARKYPSTFNGDVSNVNLSPVGEADLRSDDYVSKSVASW